MSEVAAATMSGFWLVQLHMRRTNYYEHVR